MHYSDMSKQELLAEQNSLKKEYQKILDQGLSLDLSRGKPSAEQLDMIDYLIETGIEGIELCRGAHAEKRQRILDLALEKNLFISGGTDHSGLCGGLYSSFGSEEELMQSVKYIEPLTAGTTKEFFDEIKNKKLNR